MKYHKLFKSSELDEQSMKTVNVSGKQILVLKYKGRVYAMDDKCTHAKCSLGKDGYLQDGVITCGCHGGQIDAETGKAVLYPVTEDAATYRIKIEDGLLYIEC